MSRRHPFWAFLVAALTPALFPSAGASRILTSSLLDAKKNFEHESLSDGVLDGVDVDDSFVSNSSMTSSNDGRKGDVDEESFVLGHAISNSNDSGVASVQEASAVSSQSNETLPPTEASMRLSEHDPSGMNFNASLGGLNSASMLEHTIDSSATPAQHSLSSIYHKASTLELFTREQYKALAIGTGGLLVILLLFCTCCGVVEACRSRLPRARFEHLHHGRVIYEWEQASTTATIFIRPPPSLKQGDIEVVIQPQGLRVGRKGKAPFLKEQLYDTVDVECCSWQYRHSGELQIYLTKAKVAEWPCVIVHQDRGDCDRECKSPWPN